MCQKVNFTLSTRASTNIPRPPSHFLLLSLFLLGAGSQFLGGSWSPRFWIFCWIPFWIGVSHTITFSITLVLTLITDFFGPFGAAVPQDRAQPGTLGASHDSDRCGNNIAEESMRMSKF